MTVQYGVGPAYLAQCPHAPPPPAGYRVWQEPLDGPVPLALEAQAKHIAYDMSRPLGYTETASVAGVTVILRVDPHPWTHDAQGNLVTGCFHGVTAYVPLAPHVVPPSAPARSGLGALLEVLTLASVTTGLAYTVPRVFR